MSRQAKHEVCVCLVTYLNLTSNKGKMMKKTDKYTKFILTAIAIGLFANAGVDIIKPAKADDDHIISTILNCIDGSKIKESLIGGYELSLSIYCFR